MQSFAPDHYAALGLDRDCTVAQIRAAYRVLAKQHHPDLNPNTPEAKTRTQEINVAYEILSDAERRSSYDLAREAMKKQAGAVRSNQFERNVAQEVHLRIEEFFRGTTLEVRVNDPANPNTTEIYDLVIPPDTAPGARFRVPRAAPFEGGFILIRVRARPDFRFKVRGSDLRCDLRIRAQRAVQGGLEMLPGATGARLRLTIPPGIARGEILRVEGEGLPKPRGGRGDLLVRVVYRPEVRITRTARR